VEKERKKKLEQCCQLYIKFQSPFHSPFHCSTPAIRHSNANWAHFFHSIYIHICIVMWLSAWKSSIEDLILCKEATQADTSQRTLSTVIYCAQLAAGPKLGCAGILCSRLMMTGGRLLRRQSHDLSKAFDDALILAKAGSLWREGWRDLEALIRCIPGLKNLPSHGGSSIVNHKAGTECPEIPACWGWNPSPAMATWSTI